MADNTDFSRFAGRVVFPRKPADLLSTSQCPACFTALTSTTCASCGLDLSNPAAAELHEASLAAAAGLDRRLTIIGRIRHETEQAENVRAAQQGEHGAAPTAAPTAPPTTAPTTAPTAAPTAATPVRTGKHSSVQVTMLVVGVSLLSVAAIFFLVYAFITFGIVWQSVIIAAITVATIAAASLLRRRRLPATAEAIAVFGVVLVYLDAFALRANDLFGFAGTDGYVFWGTTLLVAAVAFMFWSRVSSLRAPSIVGFSSFAVGVGVLVAGLTRDGEYGTQPFLAFAAVALAGLIHRWALPRASTTPAPESGGSRKVERVISLSTTTLALLTAFFIAFTIAPSSHWSGTIAVVALAVITGVHLWAVAPPTVQPLRAFAYIFSGMSAVFAASAFSFAALRIGSVAFTVVVPAVAAAVVALAFEGFALRGAPGWRKFSALGAWAAASILAFTLIRPLWVAGSWAASLPGIGVTRGWEFAATDVPALPLVLPGWSVLGLTIVGVIAAAFWAFAKVIGRRGPILAWFGAGVLVAAVPLLDTLWLVVAVWLALAVAAVALLGIRATRDVIPSAFRAALAATAVVAGFFAYLFGWASLSTWWAVSLVAVALLIASRRIVARSVVRATLLSFAVVLVLIGSFAAAPHIDHAANGIQLISGGTIDGLRFSSIAATALFGLFAVPLGRVVTSTDRRVMFWLAGGSAVLLLAAASVSIDGAEAAGRMLLLLPEYATSLAAHLLVLAAVVAWIVFRSARALRTERGVASVLVAPATYFAVVAVARVASFPEFVFTVAPVAAALVVAAAALAAAAVRPHRVQRWAFDVGVVLVGLPSVIVAVLSGGGFTWLVLILAAVVVLLFAIDGGGLFSSRSGRRHLGWVSLGLATGGLWWRLWSADVTDLVPYVLPLAGALIIVALLLEFAKSKVSDGEAARPGGAAPVIAFGGLVVGILPLAVNAASGEPLRALVIGAVSAALLLAGSFVVGTRAAQRWWDSAALAGGLGVLVLMVGRAIDLPVSDASRDAWIVGGFVFLLAAAFGQAVSRTSEASRWRGRASGVSGLVAMVAVLVALIPAFGDAPAGQFRVLGLVALFAVVHVLALLLRRAPLSRWLGWTGIALAGVAGFTGLAMGVIGTPEFVWVPIAVALLVTGAWHLRSVATARSWLHLAPGLVVLLLPTLLESFREQELWRIVGLGVVGIAVIVAGLVRKLQAPFVLGVVVVLVHGVSTFLPQLRAAYEFVPWWLWLGFGGVVLIAVAVRFEQRRRDMKAVITRFSELR